MSRYISYDILNIFCNNLIRAIFLPQKFLPHNRMCLHKINSYNLHTNGSQICASDLAIVCRSLGLQASFNVGSFSDQILLSIKEITQQKVPCTPPPDGHSHRFMQALYRSKTQKVFSSTKCLGHSYNF